MGPSLEDQPSPRFEGGRHLTGQEASDRAAGDVPPPAQVDSVSFGDSKLERDYRYCRALASVLRDQNTIEKLDLGSAVELSHLRSEITFEGSLSLDGEVGQIETIYGDGRGSKQEKEPEALSQIIDELNERFGLNLNERDQLFFDQIEGDWLADPDLTAQARNNSEENFRLVFDRSFVDTVAQRVLDNEDIAKRFFDDEDFKQVLLDWYADKVYRRARE